MEKINIIIINYFSIADVYLILNKFALENINKQKYRFIIVDNSGDFQYENHHSLDVIKLNDGLNLGYCGGNNLAYAYLVENDLSGDVVICNPDVDIEPDQLDRLNNIISTDGLYTIPAKNEYGRLLYNKIVLNGFFQKNVIQSSTETITETDYCPGSFLYLRFKRRKLPYLFDEDFFMYWEEVDLSLRLKELGVFSYFVNNLGYLIRKSNEDERTYNAIYYYIRNSFLLVKKRPSFFNKLDLVRFISYSCCIFFIKSVIKKDFTLFTNFISGFFGGVKGNVGAR